MSIDFAVGQLPQTPEAVPRYLQELAQRLEEAFDRILEGDHTFTDSLIIEAVNPGLGFIETDAAVNNQVWDIRVNGEQFKMRLIDDAQTGIVNWLTVDRTLNVIDLISLLGDLTVTGEVKSTNDPYLSLTATKNIEASDNGRVFGLNLAGGFTVTLPVVGTLPAGWHCTFRVETQPTTAYIITEDTGTDTNVMTGGFMSAHVTSSIDLPYSAAFTQVTFVAGGNSLIGDWVKISTNGSRFFIEGFVDQEQGVTLT